MFDRRRSLARLIAPLTSYRPGKGVVVTPGSLKSVVKARHVFRKKCHSQWVRRTYAVYKWKLLSGYYEMKTYVLKDWPSLLNEAIPLWIPLWTASSTSFAVKIASVWSAILVQQKVMWFQKGAKFIRWPMGQRKLLNKNQAIE